MTRGPTAVLACLVLAAVLLAGCGDKEPGIPRRDAAELVTLLRQAQDQSDDPQRCDELFVTVRAIAAKVRDLPARTDQDVQDSLSNGVRNLASSARQQCQETDTTTVTTPTETTETVPPPTTETVPPPTTETTPPPTTETVPPPPTVPTVPTTPGTGGTGPGNGNGNGDGQGDGNGNG